MTTTTKSLLIAALLGVLGGCTIVPGSHISNAPGWFSEDDGVEAEALPDVVEIHEINTAILRQTEQEGPMMPSEALLEEPEDYDYRVGPGDVLQITVWDHPELTIPAGSMRSPSEAGNWVHNDGTIFYPYVGKVDVNGLKVTEIRDLITSRISQYIEDPQVDVTVAAFRSQKVYVTGEVKQPGAYPITNVPMRLLDAVNAAGGLGENADWTDVDLSRDGMDYRLSLRAVYQEGNPAHNVLMRPGDVVHVARNEDNKVFVLGEVKEPRPVPMTRNGLTLAEALSSVGGFNQASADASGIFVVRRAQPNSEHLIDVYQLNARDATALVMADAFTLQSRDIVYITTAPIARWNRVIRNIMPTVQTLYYGALAEDRLWDNDN
ncbi:Polysaccharide export lipoprotein Wza [Alloalcanivorax xenomutans]|uniref:polysaccharide export protein n=1 Tax=Alloalcanivorax xenomutans TaxID=1094342 RepID=UPI0006D5C288|nr:polysaccharide export protein [Alloalcanivorax xenomutans]CUR48398.1 Polysaccharide export lipoprotein Wza [Alloalcanivorax xenomutans]